MHAIDVKLTSLLCVAVFAISACGETTTINSSSDSPTPGPMVAGLVCDPAETEFLPLGVHLGASDGLIIVEGPIGPSQVVETSAFDNPVIELTDYRVVRSGVVVHPDGSLLKDISGPNKFVFDPSVLALLEKQTSSPVALNVVEIIDGIFDYPYISAAYVESGENLQILTPCANQAQAELDIAVGVHRQNSISTNSLLEDLNGPIRDIAVPDLSPEIPDVDDPSILADTGKWGVISVEVRSEGRSSTGLAVCFSQSEKDDDQNLLCALTDDDGRASATAQVDPDALVHVSIRESSAERRIGSLIAGTEVLATTLFAQGSIDKEVRPSVFILNGSTLEPAS